MSITAFIKAFHLSLSWARSIQSMPSNSTSWRCSIMLSFHVCRSLPSVLFYSGFPTKTLSVCASPVSSTQVSPPKPYMYAPLLSLLLRFPHQNSICMRLSCILYAPAHHIFLYFITRIIFGTEYRSVSLSLCSVGHYPPTSSLSVPNIPQFHIFAHMWIR
jgi:hypothetical protein